MFVEPSDSKERYEYVIWNHEKLIALLQGTSNSAHNQGSWITYKDNEDIDDIPVKNKCGTSACAMGWAAVSGEFENIQVDRFFYEKEDMVYFLGKEKMIEDAARLEFGEKTFFDVFMNTKASKCNTIKALRGRVEKLKEELEQESRRII